MYIEDACLIYVICVCLYIVVSYYVYIEDSCLIYVICVCLYIVVSYYVYIEDACFIYVICVCLYIVVSNSFCGVFLFSLSCVPSVTSLSRLPPFGIL